MRPEELHPRLAELEGETSATWADVEPLMTDGYAHVLTLEAERLRVMRELVDLAGDPQTADQAASLTSDLDGIGTELSSLRASLHAVRRRFARDDEVWPQSAAG